ncbi:DoxX family protein [Moheibacter lacus]|uniref:DoxX family protein n=1 Tax=Moheibacter lacus TaxID=2745851 RepID=A0A838ZR92_9FLAO|nr:DoxX family protein [Moheibacter lacus]MBA5628882.1 DoxX family protein [Moheibacter lacus]
MKNAHLFSSGTSTSYVDITSLILRIFGGGFMLYGHGLGKFQNFFSDQAIAFIDPFGISATATLGLVVFAEFICAALVMLGLMTRYALVPLVLTMLYAAFIAHGGDPFGKKEMALLYLVIFMALLLLGPGKYSLDRMIRKRRATV